jgi:parallel beta-helix repeat protein
MKESVVIARAKARWEGTGGREVKKAVYSNLVLILCLLIFGWSFAALPVVRSGTQVGQPQSLGVVGTGLFPGDIAVVYVDPASSHALIGSTFTVNVSIANASHLFSYQFRLFYDTDILDAVNVKLPKGHILTPVGPANIWIVELKAKDDFNSTHGTVSVAVTLLNPESGKSGDGVLATISFYVRKPGACLLDFCEPDTIIVDDGVNVMDRKLNSGYFECTAAEHDMLVSLEVPSHLVPKESANINVHIQNGGRNNETNVVVQLSIDGTTVDTARVESLTVGSSYTMSYLWTPQNVARYNVTGHAPSLVGEDNFRNNADSKTVAVSYVIRVPADFLTISEAVRAASSGDTIRVAPGTYFEHVIIDKFVTLVGENVNDTIIDGSGTWRVVHLGGGSKISGFTIQDGLVGVYIETEGNVIEDNILRNSKYGIEIFSVGNNVVRGNTITDNGCGIISDTSGNRIYHNNFINNTDQAMDLGSSTWDYNDEGNYWSDYNGTDTNEDRIGDTPYVVNVTLQTCDLCPLVDTYTYLVGDLNDDRTVNMADLAVAAPAFGAYPRHARWNPTADTNHDGRVDMIDLVIIAMNFGRTRPVL